MRGCRRTERGDSGLVRGDRIEVAHKASKSVPSGGVGIEAIVLVAGISPLFDLCTLVNRTERPMRAY